MPLSCRLIGRIFMRGWILSMYQKNTEHSILLVCIFFLPAILWLQKVDFVNFIIHGSYNDTIADKTIIQINCNFNFVSKIIWISIFFLKTANLSYLLLFQSYNVQTILYSKIFIGNAMHIAVVRHVTGNDQDYLRKIPRAVVQISALL